MAMISKCRRYLLAIALVLNLLVFVFDTGHCWIAGNTYLVCRASAV